MHLKKKKGKERGVGGHKKPTKKQSQNNLVSCCFISCVVYKTCTWYNIDSAKTPNVSQKYCLDMYL